MLYEARVEQYPRSENPTELGPTGFKIMFTLSELLVNYGAGIR